MESSDKNRFIKQHIELFGEELFLKSSLLPTDKGLSKVSKKSILSDVEANLSNHFKSVAIRPGKPILFAKIKGKQKAIFGLPGNPISSAACFRFFVYPYLESLLGIEEEKPIKAILKNGFTKKENFNTSKSSIFFPTQIKIILLNNVADA